MSNPFSSDTQNEGMYNSQQSHKKMELLDKIKALQVEQTELNNRLHVAGAEDQELGAAFDAVTREIAERKKQLKDEYGEDYNTEYGSEGGRRKSHRRKSHRSKSRRSKSRRSKSRRSKSRRSKSHRSKSRRSKSRRSKSRRSKH
jgi:hypothetical protein